MVKNVEEQIMKKRIFNSKGILFHFTLYLLHKMASFLGGTDSRDPASYESVFEFLQTLIMLCKLLCI